MQSYWVSGSNNTSSALTVPTGAYVCLSVVSSGGTITITRMDNGSSITVADAHPHTNLAIELNLGAWVASGATGVDSWSASYALVYNRALSAAEQAQIYAYLQSHLPSVGVFLLPPVTGLLTNWDMYGGSGQQVADLSGNNYPLQLGSTSGVDANDPVWTAMQGLQFTQASSQYLLNASLLGLVPFTAVAVLDATGSGARTVLSWKSGGGQF